MTEQEPTNPEQEVETTPEDAPRDDKGRFAKKETDPAEANEAPDEPVEPEVTPEPEEFDEVDYEGKRYSIPKPLKKAIMQEADYTRKTQETAAERKAIEADRAAVQRHREAIQADFEEQAALHALSKYLDQFKSVDWNKEMEEDPISANKKFMEFQTLNIQLQDRRRILDQKQQERALQSQRETAKREEEGREMLRQIKGWSPEMESNLKAFAKERGVPNADQLQLAMHPQETQILYEAYQYRQLMKKAQQKPPAPEPKPVKTVGQASKSNPNRLDDDLPVEEWLQRREAQLRRKP